MKKKWTKPTVTAYRGAVYTNRAIMSSRQTRWLFRELSQRKIPLPNIILLPSIFDREYMQSRGYEWLKPAGAFRCGWFKTLEKKAKDIAAPACNAIDPAPDTYNNP